MTGLTQGRELVRIISRNEPSWSVEILASEDASRTENDLYFSLMITSKH